MEFVRYKSSWAWWVCGSQKCQLSRNRTSRQTWVAMLLSSTRVRRDRTSIAFVQSRCDETIDVVREPQLRRRAAHCTPTQGHSAGSIVTPGSTSQHRDELERCSFERSYLKSPLFCVIHTDDVGLSVMPRFDSVGNHD